MGISRRTILKLAGLTHLQICRTFSCLGPGPAVPHALTLFDDIKYGPISRILNM
jgi:hypothetical protein